MKKYLLAVLFFVSFLSLTPGKTLAQDFDYSRAYADYVYNLDLYRQAHSEYTLARSSYLQGQTLAQGEKTKEKTAAMLVARDEVVRTYLTAIRMKLKETSGVENSERELFFSLIDTEISWFEGHKDKISSAASLDDLVKDSNEARTRYESTELVIYKALTTISNGKINFFQSRMKTSLIDIKAKVTEVRQNGDKKTDAIERWILEVEERTQRASEKQIEAIGIINKLKNADKDKGSAYSKAQVSLSLAGQYLKEANSYMLQIVTQIKTQDE